MEWNLRPSSLWEWDNLFDFDAKAAENPKKLQQERPDFSAELDRGISSGSLHSHGDGGSAGSDFGHASSKSSVSASINSSSFGDSRSSNKFTLDGFEPYAKDSKEPARVKQLGSSPTPEISGGSGELFLSLKLGKRMYFKDICSESNPASIVAATTTTTITATAKTTPPSAVSISSSATTTKRSKSAGPSTLSPRCQVEGCNLDLSSAKDYHRKHRICENHSKSPRVIVGGVERRFCQQCSRFHGLSEFDEKKRSCRRRLSDHNARRRKPQPEAVRLNPARFSSIYDEPQKMSLVFDQQAPRLFATNFSWDHGTNNGSKVGHAKESTGFGWEHGTNSSSKSGHTKEYLSRPLAKTIGAQGHIYLPNNEIPSNIAMLYHHPHHNSTRLTPNKGTAAAAAPEFLHSGLEESVVSTELNTTQDLHRALSLLSTSSWGSRETKAVPLGNAVQPPPLHPINHHQGLAVPLASSEFWQTEQPAAIETEPPSAFSLPRPNNNAQFQDLHLFKPPTDSGFYSYQFN